MDENDIREALNRHWAASDANDFDVEHELYREDAVLEYPQSGERIRGRRNIQASRVAQPNSKRFRVRRIVGAGNLWVTAREQSAGRGRRGRGWTTGSGNLAASLLLIDPAPPAIAFGSTRRAASGPAAVVAGQLIRRRVPRPGADSIERSPPSDSARSP